MKALGRDAVAGIDELDEPQADRSRAGRLSGSGEIQVVVVLDLGARDDLVHPVVVVDQLEVDGDDGSERRRVAHLDQDPAGADVARDREHIAVDLAADHDQKGLIEAGMDALLDARPEHARRARGFLKHVTEIGALHAIMIEATGDEVKNLTLSYIASRRSIWPVPIGFARFCGVRIAAVLLIAMASVADAAPQSNPAFLGISMGPGLGGVVVETVTKDSPAAEPNGLRQNDLILQINGAWIRNGNEATAAITANHPGDLIHLDVRRGSQLIQVTVRLSTRADVLYRRFGGKTLDSIEVIDGDGTPVDLSSQRGHATIIGWVGAGCSDCARVFNRINDWIQRTSRGTVAIAVTNAVREDAFLSMKKQFTVQLTRPLGALVNDWTLFENERVHFMVVDCRGDVQFIAPIAPDDDDLDASLDNLFAATEQAQRARRL